MKPLTDSCAATLLGHMSCQNCMSAVPRALRVQILYRSPCYYYCFGSHASLFVLYMCFRMLCLSDTRLLCRCARCVTRGGWTGHHVMMTISMLWWWAHGVFNLAKTSKKLVIMIHFTAELVSCQFNTGWVTRGHFDCQGSSALLKTLCGHQTHCDFVHWAVRVACIYASWPWNVS